MTKNNFSLKAKDCHNLTSSQILGQHTLFSNIHTVKYESKLSLIYFGCHQIERNEFD